MAMHTWFECKIRYEKTMENGMQKKVTEPYLVDALSFTEAEARIIEEMTPFITGEFTVSDIKRANYSELFPSDEESADRWFKCKLIFITLDEKSGAEKKTSTQVLVQAADLRDAVKKLDEGMKGTMADYQIGMVSETPLMDVYPYSAGPNDKPEFDPSKAYVTMSIADNLKQVLAELPQGVRLVAVSKFHPNEAIEEAYQAGQRIFGESKVQEMTAKYETLPKDIEWHFIGHLQTNKIKYMIPYVAMIHGIDTYKLLTEVNKQAAKAGRIVNCLLQIHVAQEETKFGFSPEECKDMLHAGEWKELSHVRICGLMGMASNTDDVEQINREFCLLNRLFQEIKANWFADSDTFRELSMGMSHDYHEAIAAGSTLVRVGSKIFGERNY